jgi:hypothetical protein
MTILATMIKLWSCDRDHMACVYYIYDLLLKKEIDQSIIQTVEEFHFNPFNFW